MNTLTGLIGHVPAPAAYAILTAAVFAESVLVVGAFIPTLTLLLAAGALARAGNLNLALVIATATGAVVAGDAFGHRTGHLLGSQLRTGRLGRRIPTAVWQRADALMARRGGHAVFLSRFVPVVRTLTPHLAGATLLPYRRIAPYSLLAAPLWAGAEATTGYVAATSLQHVITYGGPALATAVAVIATTAVAGNKIRRRQRTHTAGRESRITTPTSGRPTPLSAQSPTRLTRGNLETRRKWSRSRPPRAQPVATRQWPPPSPAATALRSDRLTRRALRRP
ncbi:DedA family protein [Streptomyces sp. NPDC057287]|uniref:DedA family protein n=1 Tax=Streptomyces sp. NPDC057287 TaxID=3346086 RepID=UPI003626A834